MILSGKIVITIAKRISSNLSPCRKNNHLLHLSSRTRLNNFLGVFPVHYQSKRYITENTRELLGSSEDGTVSYVKLTEDLLVESLRVLEEGFYPFECVSMVSNVSKNPKAVAELNSLSTECIQEGVSIAAIDNKTNKVIGVAVNKIQINDPNNKETFIEKFVRESCKEKESLAKLNTTIYLDSSINLFQHLKVNKVLRMLFGAVTPSHRKKEVACDLTKYSLELMARLSEDKDGPKAASAQLTSSYSQRIGEKFDFEVLFTAPYNTFTFDGVKFSNIIGSQHKCIKLAAKKCPSKDDKSAGAEAGEAHKS